MGILWRRCKFKKGLPQPANVNLLRTNGKTMLLEYRKQTKKKPHFCLLGVHICFVLAIEKELMNVALTAAN